MRITVIDRTKDKLLLFFPALQSLAEQETEIELIGAQKEVMSAVQSLNSKIRLSASETGRSNVRILLMDRLSSALQNADACTLIYPILRPKKAAAFNELRLTQGIKVPISSQRVFGHVVGDVASLNDFVLYCRYAKPLKGKTILVTGGPTAEDLDPVRFLTNRSSGKMGVALARAGFISGANVLLILGAAQPEVPAYLRLSKVRSAKEMTEAVLEYAPLSDVYIGSAAVADFTPANFASEKIKKKKDGMNLPLKRTTDILMVLSQMSKHPALVGFSVETENPIQNSMEKMRRKNLDLIIVNNPKEKGAGFAQETNRVTVIERNGHVHKWPLMSKFELSLKIMHLLAKVIA